MKMLMTTIMFTRKVDNNDIDVGIGVGVGV